MLFILCLSILNFVVHYLNGSYFEYYLYRFVIFISLYIFIDIAKSSSNVTKLERQKQIQTKYYKNNNMYNLTKNIQIKKFHLNFEPKTFYNLMWTKDMDCALSFFFFFFSVFTYSPLTIYVGSIDYFYNSTKSLINKVLIIEINF